MSERSEVGETWVVMLWETDGNELSLEWRSCMRPKVSSRVKEMDVRERLRLRLHLNHVDVHPGHPFVVQQVVFLRRRRVGPL